MNVRSMWDRVTWEAFVGMIKYEVELEKQKIVW